MYILVLSSNNLGFFWSVKMCLKIKCYNKKFCILNPLWSQDIIHGDENDRWTLHCHAQLPGDHQDCLSEGHSIHLPLVPPIPSVTPHWPLVIVCVSVVNCADCDTERLQVDVWRRSQCYKTEKHLSVLNFILLRGIDLMQIWL